MKNETELVNNYLVNLNINPIIAAFTCCNDSWRDIDYTPDYNKFYYIIEGEGWLNINGEDFYPKPGQLFLMPSGVKQSYSYINENRFKKYWCHFTAKSGEMDIFSLLSIPFFVDVDDKNQPVLKSMFENLILLSGRKTLASVLEAKSRMTDIIAWYIDSCDMQGGITIKSSAVFKKLEKVHSYIREHLADPITVEELADLVHYHPNYFIRFFKQHMGTSPMQHINKMRLKKARELLFLEDIAVSVIAEKTGFNDISHFSRAFKHYTGFSPTEFRKIGT